jgi:4-hydroxybenzoate polyprenyltransferase
VTSPLAVLASVGRLHIVAIAALGTFTFTWLFTGLHDPRLAALAALDWFLVNLLNRVVDLEEDAANRVLGTDLVARHRRAFMVGGFAVLFASLALGHLWLATLTPLRLAFHALGLAYNWPLLPGRRRIKALYFFKNTASATGFMLTVFGFPLAAVTDGAAAFPVGVTWATVAFAGAFFFLFELSYEVIYDLRDAEGDALAGVHTYPVVHGPQVALRITDALLAAAALSLALGYALGPVPWRLFVMILGPALQAVLYKRAVARGITSRDCVNITWLGAGLLLAYHLWIVAGLPGV